MSWFDHQERPKIKPSNKKNPSKGTSGQWKKCSNCNEIIFEKKLEANLNVCPYCDFHFRLVAQRRLELLMDKGDLVELSKDMKSKDPLNFEDKRPYGDRLKDSLAATGRDDGTILATGKICGKKVAIAIMDFFFMGGSMGVVTGEKVARAMDIAREENIGCVVVSSSGGARMQEGILSLMQMAKTSASRMRLKKKGTPFISVLTDPTTGGCAASFAMQGDINLAEPRALVGFAGPRVIEQSIRQSLPEGFQRSEFLQEHGLVDRIVHRKNLKDEIGFFLNHFCPEI